MSEWVCQQCTLANEPDAQTCEICGAPRPAASSSRHSGAGQPSGPTRSHSSRVPLSSGRARSSRAHMAELDSDEDYRPPESDLYDDLENASSPSTPSGGDATASLLRSGVPPAGHGRNTAPWVTGPPSLPPSPPKIVKALGGENGQGQYSQVSLEEPPVEVHAVKPEEGENRRPCGRILCCLFCLAFLVLPLAAFYLLRHNKGLSKEVAERAASAERAVWAMIHAKEREAGVSGGAPPVPVVLPPASRGRSGQLLIASDNTTATTTAAAVATTRATSLPFDCAAGYANWEAGWSTQKKQWCCWSVQRGCETTAVPVTTRTTSTLPASTSTLTTTTATTTTFLPYRCDVAEADPETWMPGKQAWCCLHHDLGCPTHELPYDCHEGYEHWVERWSYGKRAWCCLVSRRACGDAPPPTRASPLVTTTRSVGRHAGRSDRGCDALCEHKGWSASCRTRIQYAAIHEFLWKPRACLHAYQKVLRECDTCSECAHSDTGCGTPAPPESVRRSMESTSAAASTTRRSEATTASTTTPLRLESSARPATSSSSPVVEVQPSTTTRRAPVDGVGSTSLGSTASVTAQPVAATTSLAGLATSTGAAGPESTPVAAAAAAALSDLDGGREAASSTTSPAVQTVAATTSTSDRAATTSVVAVASSVAAPAAAASSALDEGSVTPSTTASPTVQPVATTTSLADLAATTRAAVSAPNAVVAPTTVAPSDVEGDDDAPSSSARLTVQPLEATTSAADLAVATSVEASAPNALLAPATAAPSVLVDDGESPSSTASPTALTSSESDASTTAASETSTSMHHEASVAASVASTATPAATTTVEESAASADVARDTEASEVEATAARTTAPAAPAPAILAPPVLSPPVLSPPVLAPRVATGTTTREAEAHAE